MLSLRDTPSEGMKSYGANAINSAFMRLDRKLLEQLAPFTDLCEWVEIAEICQFEDNGPNTRCTDAEYSNVLGQAI
jgi:hypothetical protein